MSISSIFYTKVTLTPERVKHIIEKEFNTSVNVITIIGNSDAGLDDWYQFRFNFNNVESRTLCLFPVSEDYRNWGTPEEIRIKHSSLSFSCWGNAEIILTKIAKQIGGWLDINDCDDKPDIYIESNRIENLKKLLGK